MHRHIILNMDFRNVVVDRISWVGSKACYGSAKITVQTPVTRCRCTGPPEMRQVTFMAIPSQVASFVHAIEQSASTGAGVVKVKRVRECVSFDREWTVTAYDDTVWFREDGTHADALDDETMKACACILRLDGVWTTESSWGLKWKVLEIQAFCPVKTAMHRTSSWAFREEDTTL